MDSACFHAVFAALLKLYGLVRSRQYLRAKTRSPEFAKYMAATATVAIGGQVGQAWQQSEDANHADWQFTGFNLSDWPAQGIGLMILEPRTSNRQIR